MANKIKPLTPAEQLALREKARRELERLDSIYANEKIREKVLVFKEKFGICEMVYKVILEDHQYNKTGKHFNRLKVSMQQAPYALSYAGYDYDNTLLTNLFGSEDRVGQRTVKKLRDALTHKMNQNAVNELITREDELYGYMELFLKKIKEFDTK